jgi:hypothetical protein
MPLNTTADCGQEKMAYRVSNADVEPVHFMRRTA